MRRREPPVPVGAHSLPAKLRRFDPADWPVKLPAHTVEMIRQTTAANPGSGTAEAGIAAMERWYSRRRWNDARRDWCREHNLTNARGEIDWHRFGPVVHSRTGTRRA